MRRRSAKRLLDPLGRFSVVIVRGGQIRKDLDPEFTNFGQHHRFKFIPENEFWIDEDVPTKERTYFIDHMLIEHKLMAKGVPYKDALKEADRVEQLERLKAEGPIEPKQLGKAVYDSKRRLNNGLTLCMVDGPSIRKSLYPDFTQGGHDLIYRFIPTNEVWIENGLGVDDKRFVLIHELSERKLMAAGNGYGKAHQAATEIEQACRHDPKLAGWMVNGLYAQGAQSGSTAE